jgi:hypothetical protein
VEGPYGGWLGPPPLSRSFAGAIGPAFYGALIGTGSSRTGLFIGYLVGAAIMILGRVVELLIGINAEGNSLEDVTKPLTAAAE